MIMFLFRSFHFFTMLIIAFLSFLSTLSFIAQRHFILLIDIIHWPEVPTSEGYVLLKDVDRPFSVVPL